MLVFLLKPDAPLMVVVSGDDEKMVTAKWRWWYDEGGDDDGGATMATTIDQQVALDESLVPSTQRLRIGRSNFRLPSDIQSKESTL
nr:hypothetical protein [Tanacetum cinerariifolium]